MDDREWEQARRLNRLDMLTTRLAWLTAMLSIVGTFVMGALDQPLLVFAGISAFAVAVGVARWIPPMLVIEDVP